MFQRKLECICISSIYTQFGMKVHLCAFLSLYFLYAPMDASVCFADK